MRGPINRQHVTVTEAIARWGADSVAMLISRMFESGTPEFDIVGFRGVQRFVLDIEMEIDECPPEQPSLL